MVRICPLVCSKKLVCKRTFLLNWMYHFFLRLSLFLGKFFRYLRTLNTKFRCSGGARRNFVGGPKQIFFLKNIKWEGRDEFFYFLHMKSRKYTLTDLGLGGPGPSRSSHTSAHDPYVIKHDGSFLHLLFIDHFHHISIGFIFTSTSFLLQWLMQSWFWVNIWQMSHGWSFYVTILGRSTI